MSARRAGTARLARAPNLGGAREEHEDVALEAVAGERSDGGGNERLERAL